MKDNATIYSDLIENDEGLRTTVLQDGKFFIKTRHRLWFDGRTKRGTMYPHTWIVLDRDREVSE